MEQCESSAAHRAFQQQVAARNSTRAAAGQPPLLEEDQKLEAKAETKKTVRKTSKLSHRMEFFGQNYGIEPAQFGLQAAPHEEMANGPHVAAVPVRAAREGALRHYRVERHTVQTYNELLKTPV
jgi:hypothetical protein